MADTRSVIIKGTGSYIPPIKMSNEQFATQQFYDKDKGAIETDGVQIVTKFSEITGIRERRYVQKDLVSSDIATIASNRAIEDAGIGPETIDLIIVAHNFGDVKQGTSQMDVLPSLAARVKNKIGIKNTRCVAYDVLFGCPGWLQALLIANDSIKSGSDKRALVVGSETLSRVVDPYDRDSMIFADGAGAAIVESEENGQKRGILSARSSSFALDDTYYLYLGHSNSPDQKEDTRYIKMLGRKIYEFAMHHVPAAMKECFDETGLPIESLKKVFLHQANEKMDEGMIKRFFRLYGIKEVPENIMPMSIHNLGNSSVATIPTLLDMVRKGQLEGHKLEPGDVILFGSVGAGMNVNAIAYRY